MVVTLTKVDNAILKKIEKLYISDVKNGYKRHNSGKSYRSFARKNPGIAKSLEPEIKSKQELFKARKEDAKLFKAEYDRLAKNFIKSHNRRPNENESDSIHIEADRNVGTPNVDAWRNSYKKKGEEAVRNVLGKYGNRRLNTFNYETAEGALNRYLTLEAQFRNEKENLRRTNKSS